MDCIFLNTYYPAFLESFYSRQPFLEKAPSGLQLRALEETCFGESDFYSNGLSTAGMQSENIIANCGYLQRAWAEENDFSESGLVVAIEQIRRQRPAVVYIHDMSVAAKGFINEIRPYTKLIVGQIASPIVKQTYLRGFDIVFTSFPHFVEVFRKHGLNAYYMPLAFEPRILDRIEESSGKTEVTFVGGVSAVHSAGVHLLEAICTQRPFDVWGYGAEHLSDGSSLKENHHGPAWGLRMFSLLQGSRITLNRHINTAANFANNMRLFEATGCGAMLLTDYRDNLNQIFEIGSEVVAYRTAEEAIALLDYYTKYTDEAEAIAEAGQKRTLRDHTYEKRMAETAEILQRHLRYQRERTRFPAPDLQKISYGFSAIEEGEIQTSMTSAWKDEVIPAKQRALVQDELAQMYVGKPPRVFSVLVDALKPVMRPGDSLLEIGCASGYYYEVLKYNLLTSFNYTGIDYSEALVAMARDYYPATDFLVADGADLPYQEGHFDTVVSSCILLHVPNYSEHILETIRVARKYIVVHRTPICRNHATQFFTKFAYGVKTVELRFNEEELLQCFRAEGLKLLSKIEYYSNTAEDQFEATYVFRK